MPYLFSSVEEALCDEDFLNWLLSKKDTTGKIRLTAEDNLRFGNDKVIQQTIDALNNLMAKERQITPETVTLQTGRLLQSLENKPKKQPALGWRTYITRWQSVAAFMMMVIMIFGLWFFLLKKQHIEILYSERSEKKLPDGSFVIINSNSTLSYPSGSINNKRREIWLKGEAFFHVAKTDKHSSFIVHMTNFDIEVTGTQFNAINRAENSSILLKEGSVILHTKKGEKILMKPGDYYQYKHNEMVKVPMKPEVVLAWLDKKIIFENTKMSEAIKIITDHYGVEFRFSSNTVANKTLTGIMPNDNLEDLIAAIDATDEFNITQIEKGIYLISELK